MPDPIDGNVPRIPTSVSDDGYQALDGFADDAAGAAVKGSEAAKTRIQNDPSRKGIDSHAQLKAARQRVLETSLFARAEKNDQERKSKIFKESGAARKEGLKSAKNRSRVGEIDDIDLQIEAVMEDLAEILEEIAKEGLDTLLNEVESDPDLLKAKLQNAKENLKGPMGAKLAKLARLMKRLKQAEIEAKTTLQHVLTGGTGIQLLQDPRITFKKLFDRLKKWPRKIPPGRRPESTEDFDAFISWVFLPPDAPARLEQF